MAKGTSGTSTPRRSPRTGKGSITNEPPPYRDHIDATIEFFYKPRALTGLVLFLVGVWYAANSATGQSIELNVKTGVICAFMVLVITGVMEFRHGPFIRPHPVLWRIVLAFGIAYQMILVFILVQNQMDIFVIAHTLGWFAKAIIIRDYWLSWILSVLFEIMEYSLQHQLPNFAECWWDHWILDVLVTNWLGLYIGMRICDYFEMKQYSWRGVSQIASYRGKLKRTFAQFTPHSWTRFEWGTLRSWKNFASVIVLIYLGLQAELNAFYLKYLLWIPSEHPFNIYRIILVFFMCTPAVRETYQYINDKRVNALGIYAWMTVANILTELLIIIKYSEGEFKKPAPQWVYVFWPLFVLFLVVYAIWHFVLPRRSGRIPKRPEKSI